MKLLTVGDVGGDAFTLPLQFATEATAILAKRGTGKSNTAVVFAEEMYDAGIPWCAIDPKGDWYGIRSATDGEGPGLPIPVFGGLYGDLPLVPDAGAFMAELIIEQNLTCVLDVSDFTQGEQTRFLTDFGTAYYQAARRNPAVRHLFLEEADEVLPQVVPADMARCVGIWNKIVKLGRKHGIGVTLITQRSASLNKNSLSQIETLVALRTSSPQDKAAIKGWLDVDDAKEILAELPRLKNGEAWVVSPHGLGVVAKVAFRRRRTFDTGATPEVGVAIQAPTLGQIDLGAIETRMAQIVEQATADDPKTLRARIKDLEQQLAKGGGTVEVREVIREVVPPGLANEIASVINSMRRTGETWRTRADELDTQLLLLEHVVHEKLGATATTSAPSPAPAQETRAERPQTAPTPRPSIPAGTATGWPAELKGGHKRVLTVLAQHGQMDLKRLALQSQFTVGGGGFNNVLGALRTAGYITRGGTPELTDDGRAIIPADLDPLPTGAELIAFWMDQLKPSHAEVLQVVIDHHPTPIEPEALATAAGKTYGGGGFNNILGRLRTLQLIQKGRPIILTTEFAEAIA